MKAFEQNAEAMDRLRDYMEAIRITIQGLEENITILELTLVIQNAEKRIFEDKFSDVELEAMDRLRDYMIRRINELKRELRKQQTLLCDMGGENRC